MTEVQQQVSIVVPTRDRPHVLRQALESIRALEGPDLTFEILVGDNGTDPASREIAEEFGGIYMHTEKNGAAAARNLCLQRASGGFIAFLDDDDALLSGAVRAQLKYFADHPECQIVFGQVILADHKLVPLAEQRTRSTPEDGDIFKMMLSGFFPQLGGTVVRREMVEAVGLMDETLTGDQDWDWQLRIVQDHPAAIVDTPCVLFRGKEAGGSDALIEMRVGFTRKVFFRHAMPNRKRWGTMISMVRSYFSTIEHYFYYFLESAEQHRSKGRSKAAGRALRFAFTTYPTRFVRLLLKDRSFRQLHFGARQNDLPTNTL